MQVIHNNLPLSCFHRYSMQCNRLFGGFMNRIDINDIKSIGRPTIDRLLAGTHIYDFECTLSSGFPSSIEYDVGYIVYSVSVILERWRRRRRIYKEDFVVIKTLDLNVDPLLRVIHFITKYSKHVHFYCFASFLLNLILETGRR